MARLRTCTKKRRQDSVSSLLEPSESLFEPRPFGVQAESSQSDSQGLPLSASLNNAQRFGHTLGQFAISAHQATPTIQPKLAMGKAEDIHEQTADRVAAKVVDTQEQSDKSAIAHPTIQPLAQTEETGITPNPQVEQSIESKRGSGTALTDDVRAPMEDSFAANFSDVTVHTDAESDRLNRNLNSRAFTTGSDIFFRRGEYTPGNRQGKELLAHELTHVVQQGSGRKTDGRSHSQIRSKPLIQAKLMTAAELKQATSIKGAKVFHRSSYERIVHDLKEYETLAKEDKGDKKNQRLQLLKQILDEIKAWESSSARANVKTGDGKKRSALEELKRQIDDERKILLPVLDDTPAATTAGEAVEEPTSAATTAGEATKKTQEQFSFPFSSLASANYAAKEAAKKVQEEQLSFFSHKKEKILNFLHYTLGRDFNPVEVALDPKDTLLPEEIRKLVELMDKAEECERKLITEGSPPIDALKLAYGNMPKQLRPNSTNSEARLAFQVKRQLFLEAITKKENNQSTPGQAPSSTIPPGSTTGGTGGVSNVPATANTSATRSEKSTGEQVTEDILGTSRTILDISSFVKDRGKNATDIARVRSDALAGVTTKAEAMGFNVANGLLSFTDNIFNLFKAIKTFVTTKEKLQRLEAIKQLARSADGTLQSGVACEKTFRTAAVVGKASLAGATKEVVKELVPVLNIATNILSWIQQLVHIVFKIYRVANEFSLKKKAKQAGLAIKGAIKRVGLRNLELVIRDGVKQVIDALAIIAKIAGLVTGPIGQILDKAASMSKLAFNIGNDVVSKVQNSYKAGVAQEAHKAAFSGKSGSEVKVFKKNTQWALTGIILEAKGGNTIAREMLKGYFINEQMLKESSIENLRNFVMAELQEDADPKTLMQQFIAVKRSIVG